MTGNLEVANPFVVNEAKPATPPEVRVTERIALQTLQPDQFVSGIYRVGRCLQRVCRNSASYRFVELLDGASTLRCYGWSPELVNAAGIAEGAMVDAAFLTYEYTASLRGRLGRLLPIASPHPEDVLATLPTALCPMPGVVDRLREAVSCIQPLLRAFVGHVFTDYGLAQRYFQVPASFGDHHARPGGHADHCTEMCVNSAHICSMSELNCDLSIVQSLFHDVGKTETHLPSQRSREMHRMVNREALTLYLLAAPLRWLEAVWPDGARALLVGWVPASARTGRGQPVIYPPAELVRGLDRTSQAAAMQREHALIGGGIQELGRQRAVWSPAPPPTADEGSAGGRDCQHVGVTVTSR